MIIAATGYFKIVDSVGVRDGLRGAWEPVAQRVVLRKSGRDKPYTVGIQLEDETFIRGACRYATKRDAWIDFSNYADELVKDGYIDACELSPACNFGRE